MVIMTGARIHRMIDIYFLQNKNLHGGSGFQKAFSALARWICMLSHLLH